MAGRILEGRAAGLFADRLRGLAVGLHLRHARADRIGVRDLAAKARRGEDDGGIDAAVAVDEFHVGVGEDVLPAVAADAGRPRSAHPWSRRHWRPHSCAARRRWCRECRSRIPARRYWRRPPLPRRACRARRRRRVTTSPLAAGLAKGARRQPDHHARQCRRRARSGWSRRRRHRRAMSSGKMREEISEIVFIRRREQHLRRTADAKPGQLGQRLVGQQPPAQAPASRL